MSNNTPRLMLAAPMSGAGKTTVTLAILMALKAQGLSPASFKCGPDYLDPMFHQEALGIESHNLDLFLAGEDIARGLLARHAAGHDAAIIEGVMGYYDGISASQRASSFELARATDTPVLLVLPARGAALSLAALAKGFADFRPDSRIAGLILNECPAALFERLKDALEAESGLPLLGYLPPLPDCRVQNRYLGLLTPAEIGDLRQKLTRLGEQARESIDIAALLRLAQSAPPLSGPLLSEPFGAARLLVAQPGAALPRIEPVTDQKPRIAVAFDQAFCFYYADNLDVLRRLGAELVMFSPLADSALPPHTAALYVGGGYPELYAEQLSANAAMRRSIRAAIEGGLPTVAECGGFMYLQQQLGDYPMVGALPGRCQDKGRLQRFGYITLTARRDNLLCLTGERFTAHEFHYWDSDEAGSACLAEKPDGRSWPAVQATNTVFAGFPHLYFYGNINLAARLVQKAAAHGGI